jgi:hypothetical protein
MNTITPISTRTPNTGIVPPWLLNTARNTGVVQPDLQLVGNTGVVQPDLRARNTGVVQPDLQLAVALLHG